MSEGIRPDRWIYTFRRTGRRDLTDDERAELRKRSRNYSRRRFQWGCLAVLCGLVGFVGICFAGGRGPWGWAVSILGFVALFWLLSIASSRENLSLLYRRAYRLGRVDIYNRVERPPTLEPAQPNVAPNPNDDFPASAQWAEDERFEEKIAKQAGKQPDRIETPCGDVVLVYVEGTTVSRIIDAGKRESLEEAD